MRKAITYIKDKLAKLYTSYQKDNWSNQTVISVFIIAFVLGVVLL